MRLLLSSMFKRCVALFRYFTSSLFLSIDPFIRKSLCVVPTMPFSSLPRRLTGRYFFVFYGNQKKSAVMINVTHYNMGGGGFECYNGKRGR